MDGTSGATGINLTNAIILPKAMTLASGYAFAKQAPTPSGLIFDINSGTPGGPSGSIFGAGTKLQIASGMVSGSIAAFGAYSFREWDLLTIDVDQVGSLTTATAAGSGITVVLKFL